MRISTTIEIIIKLISKTFDKIDKTTIYLIIAISLSFRAKLLISFRILNIKMLFISIKTINLINSQKISISNNNLFKLYC